MEIIMQYGVLVGVSAAFLAVCYIFLGQGSKPKKVEKRQPTEPIKKERKFVDYGALYFEEKSREEQENNDEIKRLEDAMNSEHEAVQDAIAAAKVTMDWHHEKPKVRTKEDLAEEAIRIVSLQAGITQPEEKVAIPYQETNFDENGETRVMPRITEEMLEKAKIQEEVQKPKIFNLDTYSYTYGVPDADDMDALEEIGKIVCEELGLQEQAQLTDCVNTKALKKAYLNMQRAYVLNKTTWMYALASVALVGAVRTPRYKALYLVLEKTLDLLTKIEEEQIAALAALLCLKNNWNKQEYTKENFETYIEMNMGKIIDMVPVDSKVYEILERMQCIEIVDKPTPFAQLIGADEDAIQNSSRNVSTLADLYSSTLMARSELTCIGYYLAECYVEVTKSNG